jgi:hypothetical protein
MLYTYLPAGGDCRALTAAGGRPGNAIGKLGPGVGFVTVDDTTDVCKIVTSSSSDAVKSIGLAEDRP